MRQKADEHATEEKRRRTLAVANAAKARTHAEEVERQKKLVETKHKESEQNLTESKLQRAAADEGYRDAFTIVSRFCVRLSENELSNIPGLQPLRKEMLEEGLKYLQKFALRKANDPKLRNEIADTHFRIGLLTNIVGARRTRPHPTAAPSSCTATWTRPTAISG